ncbi:DUF1499 domain-containing protein [Palleronia sediminis]|uniref:DUF1499 domain-containing protein n=1 Tax=Palleronia sediminis TaxID=2547833 RepID=A0A4R6A9C9_9RHOB|nr:DUF1499 domain-containing protein [Palleronia sediminis]TDL79485.1 DUF1499 domain-containing protein [Palleronia sediminis]
MKLLTIILIALVVVIAAGALWVRLMPLPAEQAQPQTVGDMPEPGDYPAPRAFTAVREVAEPEAALRRLSDVALATRRTRLLSGSVEEGRLRFVTRSLVFGFPDITTVWTAPGRVALHGGAVMGARDMGVNAKRLRGWLDAAGLPPEA